MGLFELGALGSITAGLHFLEAIEPFYDLCYAFSFEVFRLYFFWLQALILLL